MKNFTLLLLLLFSGIAASATGRTAALYNKLTEVNKYWQQFPEAVPANVMPVTDEREMIRLHLQLVEKHLRQTNVKHLTKAQQKARAANLNNLRSYWQSGAFPVNTTHNYRLPIFIDPFDNFCAVGYLIKASGHEGLSRHISANSNFAYLADMSYPELNTWASNSGLSFTELAWIQPGYPPSNTMQNMDNGTNGTIKTIAADNSGIIYAAGSFTEAGQQPGHNNVAMYISGIAGYTWVQMGSGLNGPVNTLQMYNGELYAGGHDLLMTGAIHSVARWDGNNWTTTSPIGGFVNTMTVYNNELYVGGYYPVNQVNYGMLYKWDGTTWTDLNLPISGVIYALSVVDSKLIIGGEFTSSAAPGSPNILEYDGSQLSGIGSGLPARVRTIAAFNNHLFAGGDYVSAQGDTFGLARFADNTWQNLTQQGLGLFPSSPGEETFVSVLVPSGNTRLMVGGSFYTGNMVFGKNLSYFQEFNNAGNYYWSYTGMAALDKPVHALLADLPQNQLYVGGEFTQNLNSPIASIGQMSMAPNSAPGLNKAVSLSVYPNPVTANAYVNLAVESAEPVTFEVYNLLGQQVKNWSATQAADGKFTLDRNQLSMGTYVLKAHQNGRQIGTEKFVVQ